MAINTLHGDPEWLTLQEASKITGKKPSSLRVAIQRGKYERVRKKQGIKGKYWLIHKEDLSEEIHRQIQTIHETRSETRNRDCDPDPGIKAGNYEVHQWIAQQAEELNNLTSNRMLTIPIEFYEQQQKERDQLIQGLAMYRYKFEELDQKLRLLPAPPEYVKTKIDELEKKLCEETKLKILLEEEKERIKFGYEESLKQLKEKLEEEEKMRGELREELARDRKRSWWKKFLGLR